MKIKKSLLPARMETYAEMVELAQRAEDCQARLKNLQSRKMGSKNLGNNEGSSFRGQAAQLRKSQNKDIKKRVSSVRCRYCHKSNHKETEC